VVLAASAGACSSSSTPPDRSRAEDAASSVAGAFQLSPDQQTCLRDGFDGDARALAVVGTTSEPSAGDQEALAAVVEGCVTTEQFASSFAAKVGANLPATGTADPNAQVRCVADQVRQLDDADRRALLVGLLALGAPPTGPAAMARNDVVNAIYAACGVTLGG
jgi:hypothetical protein